MNSAARPPFTASQWQELEHQALIFKYMMAGIPVPPDLLIPIRKSFESMTASGLLLLLWEEARSRAGEVPEDRWEEVEVLQGCIFLTQSTASGTCTEAATVQESLWKLKPSPSRHRLGHHSIRYCQQRWWGRKRNPQGPSSGNNPQLQIEHGPYGIANKEFRYLHGVKGDVDERSLFSEASGSARGVGMEFPLDNTWRLMPPSLSSFPPSKPRNGSILQSNYTQLQSLQDLDSVTIASALPKQQHQQHSFFGSEFGSSEPVKQESQSLRPFFDEWPKARDSWTDLEEERANRNSFSTTQLSISIPMASSDFPTASSRSPNSEYIFSS
ncbi:growth-regulating factor 4-like protein [Cinnamomum micranthum f. kanehirae]|uniref:Growth-regulating factor n=1 Tax=Cinnamomum micranthum f. kanehirae TaxID=337451 RepID=A0A3S3PCH9_9MAGN|nr:growth-regulating factor 4-like protein [Cinnamomum micranthum f. kanehirae]